VIYKKLRDVRTGRFFTAVEAFTLPVVGYEEGRFAEATLEHVDNSSVEIAAGLDEMVHLVLQHQPMEETKDDQVLLQRFRSLLPVGCIAHRTPARPTLHYLRTLVW